MKGHLVTIQNTPHFCYAWCRTCLWKGPQVKRRSTAQRWADKHSPPYEGRHRAE